MQNKRCIVAYIMAEVAVYLKKCVLCNMHKWLLMKIYDFYKWGWASYLIVCSYMLTKAIIFLPLTPLEVQMKN